MSNRDTKNERIIIAITIESSATMGKPPSVFLDSRSNSQFVIAKNAKGNDKKQGMLSSNAEIKVPDILYLQWWNAPAIYVFYISRS